jgi:hypothetical protein
LNLPFLMGYTRTLSRFHGSLPSIFIARYSERFERGATVDAERGSLPPYG